MGKKIKNEWHCEPGEFFSQAQILRHDIHPEGLDVSRIRFLETGQFTIKPISGHIISVLHGSGILHTVAQENQRFYLEKGVHLYFPPGIKAVLQAEPGFEFLQVSSPNETQTSGRKIILRDELFLAACAAGTHSLRWILTPQYLSRRIFLNHDCTLLSKSGNPVSWFHTTMFDVRGLPNNEEGDPVFKMSYNSRTEVNVCYDVKGTARVRMALHPYRDKGQAWEPWLTLDNESTYHLNEAAGCPQEECYIDETTQTAHTFRNKHEVHIFDGHVSLFCMFDPAPAGMEQHRPGEYSDYEPLSHVVNTEQYKKYMYEIEKYDEMVNQLSMAKAMGNNSLSNHYCGYSCDKTPGRQVHKSER